MVRSQKALVHTFTSLFTPTDVALPTASYRTTSHRVDMVRAAPTALYASQAPYPRFLELNYIRHCAQ